MAEFERIGVDLTAVGGVSFGLAPEADVPLLLACVGVIREEPEHKELMDITTKALSEEAEYMILRAAEIADMDIDWEAFDKEHKINGWEEAA